MCYSKGKKQTIKIFTKAKLKFIKVTINFSMSEILDFLTMLLAPMGLESAIYPFLTHTHTELVLYAQARSTLPCSCPWWPFHGCFYYIQHVVVLSATEAIPSARAYGLYAGIRTWPHGARHYLPSLIHSVLAFPTATGAAPHQGPLLAHTVPILGGSPRVQFCSFNDIKTSVT